MIEEFDSRDSRMMEDIAKNVFNPWDEGKNDKLVTESQLDKEKYHSKIRDDLYLVEGFS